MSAAQDALRLTAEAIVEAAALDGERTAVDATVRERVGRGARAWLDITIGGWHTTATGEEFTPSRAVRDCLCRLDDSLAKRDQLFPSATTRRVREALAAALAEVPT